MAKFRVTYNTHSYSGAIKVESQIVDAFIMGIEDRVLRFYNTNGQNLAAFREWTRVERV